jgi:hypothetical protein
VAEAEASRWEQAFLLNLQRSPEEWQRRQRRVKATGWIGAVERERRRA